MKRLLGAALCLAVLAGLCVALWHAFAGRYIAEATGDVLERGWAGMGPLLYFVPVVVLWVVVLVLWLIGAWLGRRGR
jgi:hypothetical protein